MEGINMVRKTILMVLISLILLISLTGVQAEEVITKDAIIDPEDSVSDSFLSGQKGDKVKIKVNSDIPVNVYITDGYVFDDDFSDALVSKIGTTSADFSYTIPDNTGIYYLYIYNPSNDTEANVDYQYTDLFSENLQEAVEEAEGLFGFAVAICVGIIVIVVVVIVLIIYLVTRGKKDQPPQQPGYPPQQPGQQPPPPPPPQ
jgi:hypothetical protein